MFPKLFLAILLLIFLTSVSIGQTRTNGEPSLQERAQALEPFITESAQRYRIDPRILRILCFMESRYRLDAISPRDARGPMQFMPETARRYGLKDPYDPKTAIDAAAHYLQDLLGRFGGRLDLVLAAYNSGEGTVEAFMTGKPLMLRGGKVINSRRLVTGGVPPYRETREYVRLGLTLFDSRLVRTRNSAGLLSGNSITTRPTWQSRSQDFTIDALDTSEIVFRQSEPKEYLSFIAVP